MGVLFTINLKPGDIPKDDAVEHVPEFDYSVVISRCMPKKRDFGFQKRKNCS